MRAGLKEHKAGTGLLVSLFVAPFILLAIVCIVMRVKRRMDKNNRKKEALEHLLGVNRQNS